MISVSEATILHQNDGIIAESLPSSIGEITPGSAWGYKMGLVERQRENDVLNVMVQGHKVQHSSLTLDIQY